MRQRTPDTNSSACYGAGTRVEVHRSRHELESVLSRYGADEVLLVEADAKAAIQFAMHGRYVQLAIPLPDPQDARFTRTPTGKVRAATARDRAYDQALRENWRSLIVAVRGKLQSVESGISTFEQEFDRFLVPQHAAERTRRDRRATRAVNWLLGGSHAAAIALVAAFLVPASAVSAFALPTNVVGHLAAPFRSSITDGSTAGNGANGVALARGGWLPAAGHADASSPGAARLVVLRMELMGGDEGGRRQIADLSSPPSDSTDAPPADIVPAGASADPPSNPEPPAPPSTPADTSDGGWTVTSPASDPSPDSGESQPPSDPGSVVDSTTPANPPAGDPSDTAPPPPDDSSATPPADDPSGPTDPGTLPGDGSTTSPSAGNENGNGNGNGNGPGNGQGNGQGLGLGQGNGQGNGKGKGGT